MNSYSKALRHISIKDVKQKHQQKLAEQKNQKIIEREERKYIQSVMETKKYDWRKDFKKIDEDVEEVLEVSSNIKEYDWREKVLKDREKHFSDKTLEEGMTTTNLMTTSFPASDAALDVLDAGDANSYVAGDSIDLVNPLDGFEGCAIVSNGTGSGSNGGFNLGKNHLSFNGIGYDYPDFPGVQNQRAAYFGPFDASRATTIEIMAIVGNGSNGGEAPSQPLNFGYGVAGEGYWDLTDDDGNTQIAVPANGAGTLTKYTLTLPLKARVPNMIFVLNQQEGTNLADRTIDNYGVTEVSLKRLTPVNVFIPLHNPEATAFFRVATGKNTETPEQRYRRVMQQLLASKSYTNRMFGSNYPGSNFTGLRGVSASPVGKQSSYDTWSKASERNAAQATSTFVGSQQDKLKGPSFQKTGGFGRYAKSSQSQTKSFDKIPPATAIAAKASTPRLPASKVSYTPPKNPNIQYPKGKGGITIPKMPPAPTTGYSTRGAEIPRSSAARFAGTPGGPTLPKPSTPKPPSSGVKSPISKTNPTTRVSDFNARMDALRNPKSGGILQQVADRNPQQGPQRIGRDANISDKPTSPRLKPPSAVVKSSSTSAKPAAKPSFTPQQQQNIKSVQSQLRNVASNVGVKLSPAGIAAAVFKPTAVGNPAADRNPQQYNKQVQQQYAQKAASSGQFGKYAPPSTQVKTPAPAPKPAPKPTTTAKKK